MPWKDELYLLVNLQDGGLRLYLDWTKYSRMDQVKFVEDSV